MRVLFERTHEPRWLRPLVWVNRGDWPAFYVLAFGYRLVIGK